MPSRPMNRHGKPTKRREVASAAALEKLYDIGTYDRNQISLAQINRLREIMDLQGFDVAAKLTGLSQVTLLKVTSGFAHKLQIRTTAKLREFLTGKR